MRVAVLYGLAAWLILQAADVLVPALGLPDLVMRFVALLLILGFPLVVIFSWVYELTPEGLKKQHEVGRNQSVTHETGRKINYLIGALAVLAIVVVVAERFMPRAAPIPVAIETVPAAPSAEASGQAAARSIAVLPFADMSAGKDQEYFADGLSEELLNLLAKLPENLVLQEFLRRKVGGEPSVVSIEDGYRQAREAAEKALALDPQLADAHLAMGQIHMAYDWDWAAADASFRRALDLEPGSAAALAYASNQAAAFGRRSEAIDLGNKAIARDPLRPHAYFILGYVLLAANRDAEGEVAFRKALELDPDGPDWHYALGLTLLLQGKTDAALQEMMQETDESGRLMGLPLVYHALGRRSESDAALAALKSKYADVAAYQVAEVHAFRGEADLAFEWLDRAYDQRDGGVTQIKKDRLMRGLVGDPRYTAFLRKMKLPE